MSSRRRRKARKIHPVWIFLALIVASTIWSGHLPVWELILGGLIAGAVLGLIVSYRRSRRPIVITTTRARKAAPAAPRTPARSPKLPSTKQAQRNGWLPTDPGDAGVFTISKECAGDQCILCPGDGCSCSCDHDSAKIVARNSAKYDQKHDSDIPPF